MKFFFIKLCVDIGSTNKTEIYFIAGIQLDFFNSVVFNFYLYDHFGCVFVVLKQAEATSDVKIGGKHSVKEFNKTVAFHKINIKFICMLNMMETFEISGCDNNYGFRQYLEQTFHQGAF